MREIKFRAWKKTNTPEMFNDVTSVDFKKGVVGLGYKVSSWQIREDSEPLENLILMQYTGLVDTHNREIYEGDILNIKSPKGPFMAKVVNSIGTYGVIAHGVIDGRRQVRDYFPDNWNDDYLTLLDIYWNNNDDDNMLESVEIIGNRYENPELLENANGDN